MWPFNSKQQIIAHPAQTVELQLKSLSLPAAQPNWRLFAHHKEEWSTQTAIREGYNASAIAYACIEKRAKLVASVPWVVEVKRGDYWERQDNHPLALLIARPNPSESWYELMYGGMQQLDLSGDAFLTEIKAGSRGLPRELWLLPSKWMKIKPGTESLIDYYEYDNGIKRKIMPEDMCHISLPNPDSPYFGQPTLKAAGLATDVDREAAIWNKVSLQNRGASEIHIKVPDGTTPDQVDFIKQKYKEKQSGPANAREPLVTSGDVVNLGQTAVELDFVNSRRAVWTEICAVFGLSLANLGMTEAVNLANAQAMDKAMWNNTIIPLLELFERQLNHQLASEFGADVRMRPDLSNVEALQDSKADKLTAAQVLFGMGVPFNVLDQKLELGIGEIEGGDVGYIGTGLIPAGFDITQPDGVDESAYGDDAQP